MWVQCRVICAPCVGVGEGSRAEEVQEQRSKGGAAATLPLRLSHPDMDGPIRNLVPTLPAGGSLTLAPPYPHPADIRDPSSSDTEDSAVKLFIKAITC